VLTRGFVLLLLCGGRAAGVAGFPFGLFFFYQAVFAACFATSACGVMVLCAFLILWPQHWLVKRT
jgi:hypothetical protein